MTPIVVATNPAMNPMIMTGRVPTTSCEKTSCPRWVVPNQCSHEGGWRIASLRGLGSYGAIHGPTIATTTKNARMTMPAMAFLLRRKRNRRFPVEGAVTSSGTSWISETMAASTVMSALLPGAGVEEPVDEIGRDVREEHGDRD